MFGPSQRKRKVSHKTSAELNSHLFKASIHNNKTLIIYILIREVLPLEIILSLIHHQTKLSFHPKQKVIQLNIETLS